MPRYKLTVSYDGTPYCGFQRQINGLSVQQVLEEAAAQFYQQTLQVVGAGRTDAGVHALGQVCHLQLNRAYPPSTIGSALNFYLKDQRVRVVSVEEVPDTFHARFSALSRRYLYRILNRPASCPLNLWRTWHIPQELNVSQIKQAALLLEGWHDFTTFRSIRCQAHSPIRILTMLQIQRQEDEVHIWAEAPSFLHNQVRALVGTLFLVGCGRWQPDDVTQALQAKNRSRGGPTAPAHGLYFVKATYPPLKEC